MRTHSRYVPLVFVAALTLSLATAVGAGAQTEIDSEGGTLTAVVAGAAGRTISSVTSPTATVISGGSTISVGTPSTVLVEEVNATGRDWYVTLELDDDLKQGDAVVLEKEDVSVTSTTTPLVVLPTILTHPNDQPSLTNLTTSTSLGSAVTLFSVANQNTGVDYTATYTALVPFTADASGYTGTVATATADFTVTIYQ